MTFIRLFALLIAFMLPASGYAGGTKLTWYGHSAFRIETPEGKVLLIDPWITNPANKSGKEDLEKLSRADLILITHGHFDHVGDAVEIAKKTGAKLVSTFDLGTSLVNYAGYPKDQAGYDTLGNFGGELTLLNGEVRIAFIPAVHSSSVTPPDGKDIHMGGNPGGFLISVKGGPTIYDTGDTDLFSDMALVPRFRKVDVMIVSIGDHFTMGPERAAWAVNLIRPETVIPMHYGTFPILTGTPEAFAKALKARGAKAKLKVMRVGETVDF